MKGKQNFVGKTHPSNGNIGICPSCGGNINETKNSFGCANWKAGCKFVVWRKIAGKTITKKTLIVLLKKGKTSTLKGFKSKTGKEFQAKLVIKNGKVEFDFS